jgi:hypothetical protein
MFMIASTSLFAEGTELFLLVKGTELRNQSDSLMVVSLLLKLIERGPTYTNWVSGGKKSGYVGFFHLC